MKKAQIAIAFSTLALAGGTFTAKATLINISNISSLNTGAGLYSQNYLANGALSDPNWTVSLLSTDPPGQTPPGGIPKGPAYLVPNDVGFPIPPWLLNTPTSSWITYSTPTQVGGDTTGGVYEYQVAFTAQNTGNITISFASDNGSALLINGATVATRPDAPPYPNGPYSSFDTYNTLLTAGQLYTVDLIVTNTPQGFGNPTGANVQFSSDAANVAAVPEASTVAAGALMLLPLGVSALRIMRKKQMA
jgi:hypothetical protein